MLQRAIRAPDQSFFLFGARGTGKSTWARATFADASYFDLLDQEAFLGYQREPGRFGRQLAAIPSGSRVVVDEIQRIPELLNEVHRAIEARRLRFVLLGSSARKMRAAGVNLLGGRATMRALYPLLPDELGDLFDLEDAIRFGTLPIVWASENKAETARAYSGAYVSQEIQSEALVRNLGGFLRFLPAAALFHGQTVNVSAIARDAGAARTTVEGYLSILEDTLLSWRLPAFEPKPRVRERAHPKLYWIDAGIVRGVKGNLGPVLPEERGALIEGWVANLIRASLEYQGVPAQLSYLAPHDGFQEVDFIIKVDGRLFAIEVKAASRVDSQTLRGLRSAANLPGVVRRVLVCSVNLRERTEDGIEILPYLEFAKELASGHFIARSDR